MITARNILVNVNVTDACSFEFWQMVMEFARNRKIENVMITVDGNVLFVSSQKITLNSGMTTLARSLGLNYLPIRNKDSVPLPRKFLQDYFQDRYDPEKILHRYGSLFQDDCIKSIIYMSRDRKRNIARNNVIEAMSTMELLQEGHLSYENVGVVENNKKMVERMRRQKVVNPDLVGDYEITFEEWKPSEENPKVFVRTNRFPPTKLTIKGMPHNCDVKFKHYYVYSKKPGFGKSYAMETFKASYNVHFVTDVNNWLNVPKTAQILVFEEVHTTKKLEFSRLKALTGGSASGFGGNCKSYGESYEPRPDVQVVMLSNTSIYEVYGTWNNKLKRYFISRTREEQLKQRFHIVRLDGDYMEDRTSSFDPSLWSEETFRRELVSEFAPLKQFLRETTGTVNSILGTLSHIDGAKKICDGRYEALNMPAHKVKTAFVDRLDTLGISLQPALNLSLGDIANAFYTSWSSQKRGRDFDASLTQLVQKNKDPYKLCGSTAVDKRVTYDELKSALSLTCSTCLPDDVKERLDFDVFIKRLWETCGKVVFDPSVFGRMSLREILKAVSGNPALLQRLYEYYYRVRRPPVPFDDYQCALRDCLRIHCTQNQVILELEEAQRYGNKVFQPMWDTFVETDKPPMKRLCLCTH